MRSLSAALLAVSLAVLTARAADEKTKKPKDDPNQIGNRDIGKCLNFFSVEKEIALGKQLAEEVRRQARMNDDPLISEYVNRVGQNLAGNSDAKMPFTFLVVEDEAPNAFALPGGFVFVNTGLIKIADEEDEFAAAVAHEIAHVAARHLTCQATKQQLLTMLALPAGAVLGGWGGVAARQGMSVGLPAAFMKFSRANENEADFLGLQYMYAAGYDPNGAVSMFEKLELLQRQKPGNAVSRVFATHPLDATRIDKVEEEIQRILPSKPEYVVTTSEYHEIRERLLTQQERRTPDGQRPVLRRAPNGGDSQDGEGRPTIRRRDLVE